MSRIANMIHEAQCGVGKKPITGVIFKYNGSAGYSPGFAKKDQRISSMVKHIAKHHYIEARVWIGNALPIKSRNRNLSLVTYENIDTLDIDPRFLLHNQARKLTITAAHVKNIGFRRENFQEMITENVNSAAVSILAMNTLNNTHSRLCPHSLNPIDSAIIPPSVITVAAACR